MTNISFKSIVTIVVIKALENDYQEGVAIEIAEAVVGALKGELAATAVNAPMVPSEVSGKILILFLFFFLYALFHVISFATVASLEKVVVTSFIEVCTTSLRYRFWKMIPIFFNY